VPEPSVHGPGPDAGLCWRRRHLHPIPRPRCTGPSQACGLQFLLPSSPAVDSVTGRCRVERPGGGGGTW